MSCEIDGSNDIERYSRHRSRKKRRCSACPEPIRRGDVYVRIFVVHDGTADSYAHCLRCHAVFLAASRRHLELDTDQGVRFDLGCGHDWRSSFDEDPPAELARLAFLTADEAQSELAAKITAETIEGES